MTLKNTKLDRLLASSFKRDKPILKKAPRISTTFNFDAQFSVPILTKKLLALDTKDATGN